MHSIRPFGRRKTGMGWLAREIENDKRQNKMIGQDDPTRQVSRFVVPTQPPPIGGIVFKIFHQQKKQS